MRNQFACTHCGNGSPKTLLVCPACKSRKSYQPVYAGARQTLIHSDDDNAQVMRLSEVKKKRVPRMSTGIAELDVTLDGGLVPAQAIVLSAPPGMGKSTLASALAASLSAKMQVLYIPGEESLTQTRYRTDRIGATTENVYVIETQRLDRILQAIDEVQPGFLVVDSIQSIYCRDMNSSPGTVGQVKKCAHQIVSLCKKRNVMSLFIAHVTKDNELAGPRALEHLVDTFLFLDGDRNKKLRLLRSPKNRFGAPGKIGMFHMEEEGLVSISPEANASETFQRRNREVIGSVYAPIYCGDRPTIVEVQALVCPSTGVASSRTVQGVASKQVSVALGTLHKYAGIGLGSNDLYLKVIGGLSVDDPGIDLALACAIASSYLEIPVPSDTVVFGEIGLTGEVMPSRSKEEEEARLRISHEMGFECALYQDKLAMLADLPSWLTRQG